MAKRIEDCGGPSLNEISEFLPHPEIESLK